MSRYTFYDEAREKFLVNATPKELEVLEAGETYLTSGEFVDELGAFEDFMEDNGFETIDDLKNNYELKRIENVRQRCEELINAYELQHKNDVKGLEEMKKSCIKEVRKLLKEVISDMKGLYKTSVNGTTYVRLKSVVSRLKDAKFDIEERL